MGWFVGDTIVTNEVAKDETRIIAIILVILVIVLIITGLFKAYHAFIKSHITKSAAREVALNNITCK